MIWSPGKTLGSIIAAFRPEVRVGMVQFSPAAGTFFWGRTARTPYQRPSERVLELYGPVEGVAVGDRLTGTRMSVEPPLTGTLRRPLGCSHGANHCACQTHHAVGEWHCCDPSFLVRAKRQMCKGAGRGMKAGWSVRLVFSFCQVGFELSGSSHDVLLGELSSKLCVAGTDCVHDGLMLGLGLVHVIPEPEDCMESGSFL